MSRRADEGNVTGAPRTRRTGHVTVNPIKVLQSIRSKKDALQFLERLSLVADDVKSYPDLTPEPPLVVGITENASRHKWESATGKILQRHGKWVSRFASKVDSFTIVDDPPTKEALRNERLKASGWENVTDLEVPSPPRQPHRKALHEEMALNPDTIESSQRQLCCAYCWLGVSSAPAIRVCCPHCFTIAHRACVEAHSTTACVFCQEDMTAQSLNDDARYSKKLNEHRRLVAAIRIQACVRRACKRNQWFRLLSATKTLQRAIRRKIYSGKRSKTLRAALRPLRFRIFDIMVRASSWPQSDAHHEIGSLAAGSYEDNFGWRADASGGGGGGGVEGVALKLLRHDHKVNPTYVQSPPKTHRFNHGDYILILTTSETDNLQYIFPRGFKVNKPKPNAPFERPNTHDTSKTKQLFRVDIPMSVVAPHHNLHHHTHYHHDSVHLVPTAGPAYVLCPEHTGMVEVCFTLVRVLEWPRCVVVGQTKQNVQELQRLKRVGVFKSQLLADSTAWTYPSVGEFISKINFTTPPFRETINDGINQLSGGSLRWAFFTHTNESDNHAAYIFIHESPNKLSTKKKAWCVLIDRVARFYLGPPSMNAKKEVDLSRAYVSTVHGQEGMLRIKASSLSLFVCGLTLKDQRAWTRKMIEQSLSASHTHTHSLA